MADRPEPGPGQESVWDYPRPPAVERERREVRIFVGGVPIVNTTRALRVLETSHPPTLYIPTSSFRHCEIRRLRHTSVCEFKGTATYFTLIAGGAVAHRAAWGYLHASAGYRDLENHLAVYPSRVDRALLDGEQVRAQEGDFYGGWITDDVVGPFKGGDGTLGW